MKIKEKIRTFVEENKEEIRNALIGAGIGLGVSLIGVAGFKLGEKLTLCGFKNITNIDLTKDYAYNNREMLLKDVCSESAVTDVLAKCGFESLDDPTKVAVFIQK